MGLWDLFGGKPIPRKYIDLIYKTSSYWATYSPFKADPISVGDFGRINSNTGEFEYEGNIYKDKRILAEFPELALDEFKPVPGQVLEKWILVSQNAHKAEAAAAPEIDVAGVAQAYIDVEVSFQGARGAVLAMYQPKTMELPKDILLERLSKTETLRDKRVYLVSSVVSCPAYAMQVSDQGKMTTRLRFVGQVPVPHAPGVTAGGELRAGWVSENVASSYQEAHNKDGEYVYHPLYTLKKIWRRPPYRQAHPVRLGDDIWMDVSPPWIPLDDDGNEVEIDDDDDDDD